MVQGTCHPYGTTARVSARLRGSLRSCGRRIRSAGGRYADKRRKPPAGGCSRACAPPQSTGRRERTPLSPGSRNSVAAECREPRDPTGGQRCCIRADQGNRKPGGLSRAYRVPLFRQQCAYARSRRPAPGKAWPPSRGSTAEPAPRARTQATPQPASRAGFASCAAAATEFLKHAHRQRSPASLYHRPQPNNRFSFPARYDIPGRSAGI